LDTIYKIEEYLPKIGPFSIYALSHLITQSEKFNNHLAMTQPDNKFELMYANWIATGNESFIDYYKDIVAQACFAEFLEWYEYIAKNILRDDVQSELGIKFDYDAINWENEVKKSELFGWAWRTTDYKHFMNNLDKVSKIGAMMNNFFNDRKPLSTLDADYFESDHAQLVLDSIDKILINNDRQEIIDHLNTEKILCMIEVYGWDNRFNNILLKWISDNRNKVKHWA